MLLPVKNTKVKREHQEDKNMEPYPEINTYSHSQIFQSANLLKKLGVLIIMP